MRQESLAHAPNPFFTDADNDLWVGGESVLRLAERVGAPFYLYSRAGMHARLDALRKALPREVEIHYAIKANPMPDVVRFYATAADGMDVASIGEMELALDVGARAKSISFAGPGKSRDDLRRAIYAGVIITVESETELARLLEAARDTRREPMVCLRVNPEFELKGSGMKMGGGAKQFGIDEAQLPDVFRKLSGAPVRFVGLHIFSGSQSLNTGAVIDAQTRSVQLGLDLARLVPQPMTLLNIGGGFGIPYFPGDLPLDIRAVGENLGKLQQVVTERAPQCRLCIELGRYLVGEAGIYVCSVLDKKTSRGRTFLVTDGGLNHHLAVTGNFGQLIRRNYPLRLLPRTPRTGAEVVHVVGRLCTPLDMLGEAVALPPAHEGDFIAILQSGAYGLTASPTGFLSHPPPREILL